MNKVEMNIIETVDVITTSTQESTCPNPVAFMV